MPPIDRAVLAYGTDEIRVARIDAADEAVAAADGEPIFVDDAAVFADRWAAPRAVVLQPAEDPVRLLESDGHVIELAQGCGVDVVPVAAAVVAGIKAAIAADEHVASVAGINPEGVAVGVRAAAEVVGERQPAIFRLIMRDAEDVHAIGVLRIDTDQAEVHGPRVERVDALPRFAAVT